MAINAEDIVIVMYGIIDKHGKTKEFANMVEGHFDGKNPSREEILRWMIKDRENIFKILGIKED